MRTHGQLGGPPGGGGGRLWVPTPRYHNAPLPPARCTSPLTPSVPPEPRGGRPLLLPRERGLCSPGASEPRGTPGATRAPHLNVTFSGEHPSEGAAFLQQRAWRCFISKGRLPLRAEGPLRNEMAGALMMPGNRGHL